MEHFQTEGQHLGGGRVLWDVLVAVGFLAQKVEQVQVLQKKSAFSPTPLKCCFSQTIAM